MDKKKRSWYYRMTLSRKRGLWGLLFLSPWILGFLLFYLRPFIDIIRYSFNEVELRLGEVYMTPVGFANYRHAFTVNPHFNQFMITLLYPALVMVFIVVVFSLLVAMLINGKYPMRGVVRTIFFIPIIMGTNIAAAQLVGLDSATEATVGGAPVFFGGDFFFNALAATGLPVAITGFVNMAVAQIFGVLARSGVPTLIFLAGLQSIPPSLYEVATIEGCTGYESFWHVTLPMISPMLLLSVVYTTIELFAAHSLENVGGFFAFVNHQAFALGNPGFASAMVVVYLFVCLIVIGLLTWIISKGVFYYE